jgi:hypothetical protein
MYCIACFLSVVLAVLPRGQAEVFGDSSACSMMVFRVVIAVMALGEDVQQCAGLTRDGQVHIFGRGEELTTVHCSCFSRVASRSVGESCLGAGGVGEQALEHVRDRCCGQTRHQVLSRRVVR